MAHWVKTTSRTPSSPGLKRLAVHPNGVVYFSYWTGTTWCIFSSDPKTALKMKDQPLVLPFPMYWSEPPKSMADLTHNHFTHLTIESIKKIQRAASVPSVRETPKRFGSSLNVRKAFFMNNAPKRFAIPKPHLDRTEWYAAEVNPEFEGVYEAVAASKKKADGNKKVIKVKFENGKWRRPILKWRGITTDAHQLVQLWDALSSTPEPVVTPLDPTDV